jgi:hypothetical protein
MEISLKNGNQGYPPTELSPKAFVHHHDVKL